MLVLAQLVVLLVSVFVPITQANQFNLPNAFIGSWIGKLEFSMFGPYDTDSFLFSVSQAPNGDYLFENNIVYDELFHMGYQRFYVEGSGDTASSLWYCGRLTNYSDVDEITGGDRLNGFKALTFPAAAADTSVTFCLDSDNPKVMPVNNPFKFGCTHCDCANWTISYDESTDTLISQLSMSGSEGHTHSKHVWVTLERTGPAPAVTDSDMPEHGENFSCDFEEGGRDSESVDRGSSPLLMNHAQAVAAASPGASCPHLKQQQRIKQLNSNLNVVPISSAKKNVARKSSSSSSKYDHCYVINAYSDYRVAWSVDFANSLLHVSISSSVLDRGNDTYVAIGFRPKGRVFSPSLLKEGTGRHMNFGMEGADIVAGSVNKGLRTLYAELYTGPPVPDNSLKISDSGVELVDGRVIVTFTRPLVGGYLVENFGSESSIISGAADIIWAVGVDSASKEVRGDDDNTSGCEYHSNTRGIRFINWEDPTIAMSDDWKC